MRAFLLLFLVAAAVTYLLTVIAREIALRTGAVARVRDRDVHDVPIPYMGGVAMYGGLLAAYLVARQLPFVSNGSPFITRDAGAVLIAGAVICLVGVIDDILELDALTKLGGQVIATAILIAFGIQYSWIPTGGDAIFSLDPAQGAIVTGVMVIATVNAVNFIDGLDGLAAGVVGIGALAFFAFSYTLSRVNEVDRATTPALLSVALAGACAGFLMHNWNPARLFMGDSGSMLIGLVLSASAVSLSGTTFTASQLSQGADGGQSSLLPTYLPLVLPMTILLVPLVDLVMAVLRRSKAGRSPFSPDKQHLHHRLLRLGHSQRRAVLIMWSWAALVAFGSAFAALYAGPLVWSILAGASVLTLVFTFVLPKVHTPLDRSS